MRCLDEGSALFPSNSMPLVSIVSHITIQSQINHKICQFRFGYSPNIVDFASFAINLHSSYKKNTRKNCVWNTRSCWLRLTTSCKYGRYTTMECFKTTHLLLLLLLPFFSFYRTFHLNSNACTDRCTLFYTTKTEHVDRVHHK